jgi:formylglycine-generating enzyme required for sulfatase activity
MVSIDLAKDFIKIPAGDIELRDDRIKRRWTVKVDSFLIAKFPVTQALYERTTNENPSGFRGRNLPVESVSWIEAVKFCNLLSDLHRLENCYTIESKDDAFFDKSKNGFRLPTEAEWEFACKSGTNNIRYGNLHDIAWFKENADKRPHDVGLKRPNDWGVYDMLGNVWEWCSDIYDEAVYGRYRIFRGGGWNDEERSVMATTRRRSHPASFKIDDLGFRIAINLTV